MKRNILKYALTVGGVPLLIGVVVVLILGLRSTTPPHPRSAAQADQPRGIPAVPACPNLTGPLDTNIAITANAAGNNFHLKCYYAAADHELTIRLKNSVFALLSHTPIPMTLVISPSNKPALESVPGRSMLSVMDKSNALFVGRTVIAPDTGVMKVPPLAEGIYVLQVAQIPHFMAALVVK